MRKTEESPQHYDLKEQKRGCAIILMFIILVVNIVLLLCLFGSCGKLKQSKNCEAYHTGNTNHRPGK